MVVNYVNLTNGLQAIEEYSLAEYKVIRIQSTACEQKRFENIILDLDYNFIYDIVIGNTVTVYDYGANKPVPRAIWQGLEFIKFVINKVIFGRDYTPEGRASSSKKFFDEELGKFRETTINKLKYFRKFVNCEEPSIHSVTSPTNRDGDYEYYARVSKNACRS